MISTLGEDEHVETAIVAIPMLEQEYLTDFVVQTLGENPYTLIVNGTGAFKHHLSVADCGIAGQKLASDFYGTSAPIVGGSS